MTENRPWTKTEVRAFMKDARGALRLCEKALQRDDYYDAYQMLYMVAGGAGRLTDIYERWEIADE